MSLRIVGRGAATASDSPATGRVIAFLIIMFATEAANGPSGLLQLPVLRYAKDQLHLSATAISLYQSLIAVPWLLKPLFGLISDVVPINRSRRQAYLVGATPVALGALIALMARPGSILLLSELMLLTTAMAVCSSVCGALLVENGQRLQASNVLVNYQWLALNLTLIASALTGGYLTQWLAPAAAVGASAAVLTAFTALAMTSSILITPETRRPLGLPAAGIMSTISRGVVQNRLPVLAIFLFLYMFSPSIGLPIYFHMTNDLHFSQQFIGTLQSIGSAGAVCGALAYRLVFARLRTLKMLQLTIVMGILSTLAYLFLAGPYSAGLLNFQGGFVGAITVVTLASLVADFCPAGPEGFTFAILATIENLAVRASDISGSYVYDHLVDHRFVPLIIISAFATLLCVPLLPFLNLYDKPQGVAYRSKVAHE
jgi:MFS family permease